MLESKRKRLIECGTAGKTAVVGAEDREMNRLTAATIKTIGAKTLHGFLMDNMVHDATVYSDDSVTCKEVSR